MRLSCPGRRRPDPPRRKPSTGCAPSTASGPSPPTPTATSPPKEPTCRGPLPPLVLPHRATGATPSRTRSSPGPSTTSTSATTPSRSGPDPASPPTSSPADAGPHRPRDRRSTSLRRCAPGSPGPNVDRRQRRRHRHALRRRRLHRRSQLHHARTTSPPTSSRTGCSARSAAFCNGCDLRRLRQPPSAVFRPAHLADTMVLVDPDRFADRLAAAGFEDIEVDTSKRALPVPTRSPPRRDRQRRRRQAPAPLMAALVEAPWVGAGVPDGRSHRPRPPGCRPRHRRGRGRRHARPVRVGQDHPVEPARAVSTRRPVAPSTSPAR